MKEIFEKWDLPYAQVGEVKDDGFMRVKDNGRTVVEIPARALADEAPIYSREARRSQLARRRSPTHAWRSWSSSYACRGGAGGAVLPSLLAHPSIASKRWVWRQYDHMVRLGATVLPGLGCRGLHRARGRIRILAATSDCNAIYLQTRSARRRTHCRGGGRAQSGLLGRDADRRDGQS